MGHSTVPIIVIDTPVVSADSGVGDVGVTWVFCLVVEGMVGRQTESSKAKMKNRRGKNKRRKLDGEDRLFIEI